MFMKTVVKDFPPTRDMLKKVMADIIQASHSPEEAVDLCFRRIPELELLDLKCSVTCPHCEREIDAIHCVLE